MKKLLSVIASIALISVPVMADPLKDDEYYSNHSMGCMLLQECKDDVKEITTLLDISSNYPNSASYYPVSNEFNRMLTSLNRVGVKVFLADEKYFPVGHRGVYHTVSNNFYLNRTFMNRPGTLMSVIRHEGWHAAQDCMAGTIDNSLIAIILPEDQVPPMYQNIVKKTYKFQPGAIPWEKEAYWAGRTEGMTEKALSACAAGQMWNVYKPTPLTREYLVKEGYISK